MNLGFDGSRYNAGNLTPDGVQLLTIVSMRIVARKSAVARKNKSIFC